MDTVKNRAAALVREYVADAPALGLVALYLDGLSEHDIRTLLLRLRDAVDYMLGDGSLP